MGKITSMGNFRLKVFRAVARYLNFRRAAEELCLTQPAVTLQIKALEQDLGVQLFDRSGAHITLTPAGAMLLKYAGKIEKLEAATLAALAPFSEGQRGELRIGASLTIAQYILPHLLGAFQQQHPQVRPIVTTCNTEQVWKRWWRTGCRWGLLKAPLCVGMCGPKFSWKMKLY
jgi:DNA-binding transcriptional LysR family regulator